MAAEHILFFAMAALALFFGAMVVFHRNPIHSALALIALLFNTAGLYAMLMGEFIAVIQALVYTGAIMVLFLFVIMLLNLRSEALGIHKLSAYKYAAIAAAAAIGAKVALVLFAPSASSLYSPPASLPHGFGGVEQVGEIMLAKYFIPFEAASALLLTAIVGGVVLGKKKL